MDGPPLSIVIVSRRFWPLVGGAERVLRCLGAALVRQGHAVTVVTQHWDRTWPAEEALDGCAVVRLSAPHARFVGTACYVRRLGRWLRAHADQHDVAYVSMLKHSAYAAVHASERSGWPVVLRPECSGQSGDVHWQRTARFGTRIASTCRRASGFVAISTTIRDELVAAGYPAQRIADVPNGVPVPEATTAEHKAHARATLDLGTGPVAVFTGRLAPQKNLDTLVHAWAAVQRNRPGGQLVLVGEGPCATPIRQQVAALDLDQSVRLVGAHDDVESFLRAADVFVLPSRDEGMSIALLEAMAVGLPVVASNISANQALVQHGVTGLLAGPDCADEIAEAMRDTWGNPDAAARRARAARQCVIDRYSIDAVARRHATFFAGLVRERAVLR